MPQLCRRALPLAEKQDRHDVLASLALEPTLDRLKPGHTPILRLLSLLLHTLPPARSRMEDVQPAQLVPREPSEPREFATGQSGECGPTSTGSRGGG